MRNAEGYNRDHGLFTGGMNRHVMEGADQVGSSFGSTNFQTPGAQPTRKPLQEMNAEELRRNEYEIKTQHIQPSAKPAYTTPAQRQAPAQRRYAAPSTGGAMHTGGASYADIKSGGPAVVPQAASSGAREMPEGDIGTPGTKAYQRNMAAMRKNSPGIYR